MKTHEAMHWKMKAMIEEGWQHEDEPFYIFRKKNFYDKYRRLRFNTNLSKEEWFNVFQQHFNCFFSEQTTKTAKNIFKTYLVDRQIEENLYGYKVIDIETNMLELIKQKKSFSNTNVILPYFALQNSRSLNTILAYVNHLDKTEGINCSNSKNVLDIKDQYNNFYKERFYVALNTYKQSSIKIFHYNMNSAGEQKNWLFLNDTNILKLNILTSFCNPDEIDTFNEITLSDIHVDITTSHNILFLVQNYNSQNYLLYQKLFEFFINILNSILIQTAYDYLLMSENAKNFLIEQLFLLHQNCQLDSFYHKNKIYDKYQEINNKLKRIK